jgi:hypothetical protein
VSIPGLLPPLAVTLVFAPVGEESFKLLLAFGLEKVWHRFARQADTLLSFASNKLAFPATTGVAFGIFEHFFAYGGEGVELLGLRVVAHVLYVSLSWLMCHQFWSKGVGFTVGMWTGLAFGAFVHCIWNYISLVRRVFGSGLLVRYL